MMASKKSKTIWISSLFISAALLVWLFVKPAKHGVVYVAQEVEFTLPSLIATAQPTNTSSSALTNFPNSPTLSTTPLASAMISPTKQRSATDAPIDQDAAFARFIAVVNQHLRQGVAQDLLWQSYQDAKAAQLPIDWIFANEKRSRPQYTLADIVNVYRYGQYFEQRLFYLPDLELELSIDAAQQQQAQFKTFLQRCPSCQAKELLSSTLFTFGPKFDYQPDSRLVRDSTKSDFAIAYALGHTYLSFMIGTSTPEQMRSIDLLLASDNEYLRKHGQLGKLMLANDTDSLLQWLQTQDSLSIAQFIVIGKQGMGIDQMTMMQAMRKRLNREFAEADLTSILEFSNYHAQYFSLNQASELLTLVQRHYDIQHSPIWQTLQKNSQLGVLTLGNKWQQQHRDGQFLFDGILGSNGMPLDARRVKSILFNKMINKSTADEITQRWQSSFANQDDAARLFGKMNWSIISFDHHLGRGLMARAEGNPWNDALAELNRNNIAHQFDSVANLHWQLMDIVEAELAFNAMHDFQSLDGRIKAQIEELKFIYPLLLPYEQARIDSLLKQLQGPF